MDEMKEMTLYAANRDPELFKTYHRDKLYQMYGWYADMKMSIDDLENMVPFDEFCEIQFEELLKNSISVDETLID